MANNINWGKIYESTWFGSGVVDNNISWGIVYADLGSIMSNLLDSASIVLTPTAYDNGRDVKRKALGGFRCGVGYKWRLCNG
jgi:hypothetical protein